MYIGIFQAVLNALGLIWNKKIVSNTNIGNHLQIFLMRIIHIFLLFCLVIFGFLNFSVPNEYITCFNFFIIIVGCASLYITYLLRNIAYRNEKISTLQPFAMLYQVLPPLIAFIFISSQRTSIVTFIASLLASLIIIGTSVDFKNLKISKYSAMVALSSIIKSVQMFYMIYLISFLDQSTFYIIECVTIILISSVFSFRNKEFSNAKQMSLKYIVTVLFGNSIILASIILSLTMFKEFGVIVTSLIGLLYLVFAFIFSYVFLKEIPSKKDVIITSLVSICVIIGVVFR